MDFQVRGLANAITTVFQTKECDKNWGFCFPLNLSWALEGWKSQKKFPEKSLESKEKYLRDSAAIFLIFQTCFQ